MFSSAKKCFGTEFREFASIFVPRNGIPSCFFFRRMVRNRIPSDCFYFCSTERNSELFLFRTEWFRTEFREFASIFVPPSIFLLCGWFGTEFREFCSAEQLEFCRNKTVVYAVFCGINFLLDIANPNFGENEMSALSLPMQFRCKHVGEKHSLKIYCIYCNALWSLAHCFLLVHCVNS